jgi:SseB protein N-terminal domain
VAASNDLIPREGRWTPGNEVDEALLTAARAGDVAEALGIVAMAPLYLPGVDEAPGAGQRLLTKDREGVPYLLVFTSVPTLHRVIGRDGWRSTTLAELVRAWPDLTGRPLGLAINPATPVAILVAAEDVAGLLPPVDAGFEPANDTERGLRDALEAPDGGMLLDLLATSRVLVTTRAVQVGGVWLVPVFTSPQRCTDFLAPLPPVQVHEMYLIEVLSQWPGPEYQLAVNPGSSIGFSLDGALVPGLLAHAAGLARRLRGRG